MIVLDKAVTVAHDAQEKATEIAHNVQGKSYNKMLKGLFNISLFRKSE